ncbi:ApeI family dehydratase [Agarivorans gilvus]|uniref:ApeI dehydratase-like domain-containing protein n=1 Tax=Agarivorans gilvus TaxID=680279 RepID=A0ABQ1I1N6_9ALTE|nr:hypothetical protein [Agarivorans gilvus]GGB07960.1 hypothetical protein GCM10007414_21680 [Agarivorans gilvus]
MKDFGRPLGKLLEREGEQVKLSLFVSKDLACLQGHFPQLPVVPGLAQLHWAVLFGAEYVAPSNQVQAVEALKYQHVMQPENEVQLELRFDPKSNKLHFRYYSEQHAYSSGRVVLKVDNV